MWAARRPGGTSEAGSTAAPRHFHWWSWVNTLPGHQKGHESWYRVSPFFPVAQSTVHTLLPARPSKPSEGRKNHKYRPTCHLDPLVLSVLLNVL